MASINVGGKQIPMVIAKHDKTLSGMSYGGRYFTSGWNDIEQATTSFYGILPSSNLIGNSTTEFYMTNYGGIFDYNSGGNTLSMYLPDQTTRSSAAYGSNFYRIPGVSNDGEWVVGASSTNNGNEMTHYYVLYSIDPTTKNITRRNTGVQLSGTYYYKLAAAFGVNYALLMRDHGGYTKLSWHTYGSSGFGPVARDLTIPGNPIEARISYSDSIGQFYYGGNNKVHAIVEYTSTTEEITAYADGNTWQDFGKCVRTHGNQIYIAGSIHENGRLNGGIQIWEWNGSSHVYIETIKPPVQQVGDIRHTYFAKDFALNSDATELVGSYTLPDGTGYGLLQFIKSGGAWQQREVFSVYSINWNIGENGLVFLDDDTIAHSYASSWKILTKK